MFLEVKAKACLPTGSDKGKRFFVKRKGYTEIPENYK
jgi:hypothetical protein